MWWHRKGFIIYLFRFRILISRWFYLVLFCDYVIRVFSHGRSFVITRPNSLCIYKVWSRVVWRFFIVALFFQLLINYFWIFEISSWLIKFVFHIFYRFLQNYVILIFIFARGVINKFFILLFTLFHFFGPVTLFFDVFLVSAFHKAAHLIGWGPLRFLNEVLRLFV